MTRAEQAMQNTGFEHSEAERQAWLDGWRMRGKEDQRLIFGAVLLQEPGKPKCCDEATSVLFSQMRHELSNSIRSLDIAPGSEIQEGEKL